MMAARKDDNGVITPIQVETRKLNSPAVCGKMTNDEQINITLLRQTMANKLEHMSIKGIYIGSCLRSMRSRLETVEFALNGRKTVTNNDTERLNVLMENLKDNDTIKIYESVKRRDNVEVANLTGEIASKIEEDCVVVSAVERFRPNYRTILPADIEIRGIEPLPVAKAFVTTTEEQRINGCVVVDLMSDMTSFTVFKDNAFRGTAVVPFGFNDILHDADKDDLTVKELRTILVEHWKYPVKAESGNWTVGGKKVIFDDEFILHVNSRIEEILNYGKDWIESFILFSDIKENIVVTGLLSNRPGYVKLVGTLLDGNSIEGRLTVNVSNDTFKDQKYWGLLGVINAAEKCCIIETPAIAAPEPEAPAEEPVKPGKKAKGIWDGMRDLFSDSINGEETE